VILRAIAVALGLALLAATPARADFTFSDDGEPAFLVGGAGVAGAFDNDIPGYVRIEARASEKLWAIRPFVGVEASSEGASYLYAGLSGDIFLGRRLVLTPNLALGWWRDGGSLELGYALQFRSGFEFAYRFDDRSRLGFAFHHHSNANLGDRNPGTETAMLQYSLPLWRLTGR